MTQRSSTANPVATRDVPVQTYSPAPVQTYDAERRSPFDCEVYGPGPSDFRLVLRKPLQTRDSILEAQGPGIVCSLGHVWRGDLKPVLETHVQTIKPLLTPFCLGETLSAEPTVSREQQLSTGRTWGGTRNYIARVADSMGKEIRDRAMHDGDAGADLVDLSSVMGAMKELKDQALGGNPQAVHAALDAVRDAIANVQTPRRTTDASGRFLDPSGDRSTVPGGNLSAFLRRNLGRMTAGRARGSMQRANEAHRRARAEERRQLETETPLGAGRRANGGSAD